MVKNMLITGGAGGVAKCLAQQAVLEGYEVFVVDRDHHALLQLKEWADKKGQNLHITELDLTDIEKTEKILGDLTKRVGKWSVWINSAGIRGVGDFQKMSAEEFSATIDLNLHSAIRGTRMALQNMERHGAGTIVNIASIAGHVPAPFMTAYATSKYALVGFTRSLQAELEMKDSPVKMMLVSPGFVASDFAGKGSEKGFPDWLSPVLANPDSVAEEILSALHDDKKELVPTWNGKALMALYKIAPKLTVKNSKLLLTKSIKDVLLGHYKSF